MMLVASMADPSALQALWRERLKDARLKLDFARSYFRKIHRDFAEGGISAPLEKYALDQALRAEKAALAEYGRISAILTDLTLHGKLAPDGQHKTAGEGE